VRRRASQVSLILLFVALGWAIPLTFADRGFDTVVLGLKIRSHDPARIWLIAAAAFVVLSLLEGLAGALRKVDSAPRRLRGLVGDRVIVGLLAGAVTVVAVLYGAPVAGGADSFGYVSQADLWSRGYPFIDQPWMSEVPWPSAEDTFSPLGYRPVGGERIAPIYSPGLPLLMAAVQTVAGFKAMFLIGPIAAGLLVGATYGIGCRLGSQGIGLAGAWLTATSPTVITQMLVPMTDVPPAATWALGFYLLFGTSQKSAFGAGLCAGIATLIRPNLVPSALIMLLWLAWTARRRLGSFLLGLLPLVAALTAIYAWLYGSPMRSGYAPLSEIYTTSNVSLMLPRYLSWLAETQTPLAWLGMAAVLLPMRFLWPETRDRSMVVAIGLLMLSIWAQFSTFQVLDAWWYLRYVLTSWPAIMLGMGAVAVLAVRRAPLLAGVVSVAIVGLGMWTTHVAIERGALEVWKAEYKYPAMAQLVRERIPANSIVMAVQHGGSVRYYGGRTTMRWDLLDGQWLDRAVTFLSSRNVRTYLLVEDPEIPDFKERFGDQVRTRLERREVLLYEGSSRVHLYDLTDESPSVETSVVVETYAGSRYARPVPSSPFVLR
jgi:hypothetical protein